ncbi:MAG: DUF6259 domain-containing protein [Bacteroidales bacterium]
MCQNITTRSLMLNADKWVPVVEQVGDERESFGYQIKETEEGLKFSLTGYPGSTRTVHWTRELDKINLSEYKYIVIEYKTNWLNNPSREIIGLTYRNEKGISRDTTLLRVNDLIDDGRPHTLILKSSLSGTSEKLTVRLITRSSSSYIAIKSFRFVKSYHELPVCIDYEASQPSHITAMNCLDITGKYNAQFVDILNSVFEKYPVINDGGRYFSTDHIEVSGIPFQVRPEGKNLFGFPPPSRVNDEIIEHYGSNVRRGSVSPISRDDKIEVDVKSPATEIFFLLVAEHPKASPRDPSNLGFRIEDIETFAVELIYEDGIIDYAFPYSIKDDNHIIQGTTGLYVVPATGKPLDKIIFHNRTLNKEYYLAAVTVNKDSARLFPKLIMDPGPKAMMAPGVPDPVITSPYLQYQNGILKAGNTYINMIVDVKNVFTITQFDNKWLVNNAIDLDPSEGFEIKLGDRKIEASNIKLLNVSEVTGTTGKDITLIYGLRDKSVPLEFRIQVSVSDEPEIGMQMTVINNSDSDVNANVKFPVIRGIQMGKYEDVWYYYPSYRNVFSNQAGSYDHIYSLSFPMQFYDIFNPTLGGGFYLATRETDVEELRRYGFRKGESGITCFLEYPGLHTLLKPAVPKALCKTVLGVHTGDWHEALNVYKTWLQTWYKPVNAQDKQWYRECFWLLCDYPDNIPADARKILRDFTWYDLKTKKYRMLDILAEHKRTVGRDPDILHFWSWTYNMPQPYTRWGAYGTNGEYESMGGIKSFNRAIREIENKGIRTSIYIDASLCNPDLPIAKRLGSRGYMLTAKGEPLIDYGRAYRMCPGSKPWREYMQGVYTRVNRDLGINILYVDEWAPPFYNGHNPIRVFNCYSKEHEHDVPANMNLEVFKYMSELRTAVTKKAALYGEYPDVDVNTRFYDSNITYYLTEHGGGLEESRDNISYDLSPKQQDGMLAPYLQLYKFVFPGCVQLLLPNDAMFYSWNRLKFSFLNGDAVYDSFWLRDESKAEAFMVKSHDIKKKYADCFTSDTPEPLVATEQTGILANKYPGNGRILWVVYNQRFTTVRGEIMKIKHVNGATYYDVWNDKPLQVRIAGDYAYISQELYPQAVGCISQVLTK